MRYLLPVFIVVSFSSCWIPVQRLNRKLEAKGYNPYRDTIAIKPYETLIIHKGFIPQFRECEHTNELNAEISIKGYEDAKEITLGQLKDTLFVVLSDTSVKQITGGQLLLSFPGGGGFYHKFLPQHIDSLRISYPPKYINRTKKLTGPAVIYFFCVTVMKNGTEYTVPSRKYWVRQ